MSAVYQSMLKILKRSTYPYLEINLDDLARNVSILRDTLKRPSTGIIGVVKAGAYGHGSVQISKHLKFIGVERLAVATLEEAILLRKNNINGAMHLLGNTRPWQIETCLEYDILPTVCSSDTVKAVAKAKSRNGRCHRANHKNRRSSRPHPVGAVNINIDTGMSRDGCQPEDFKGLFELCENNGVPVDSVSTHFADSWYNKEFTMKQYNLFLETVEPFRCKDIKLHVANSGAVLRGVGTDLDFIRPGVALYGLPVDKIENDFTVFGFKPIAKIKTSPNLVKQIPSGRSVGYGLTYTASEEEWIATFPVGYGHGFWQPFSTADISSSPTIIQDSTGSKCPVVGTVSSDALTVKLTQKPDDDETFTLMTNDYDKETSAAGYAEILGTDSVGFCMRLSTRMSKIYTKNGSDPVLVRALSSNVY